MRTLVGDFIGRTEAAFRARFEADAARLSPCATPDAAAAMAAATMHTLAIRARTGSDEAEVRRVARAHVDMICALA